MITARGAAVRCERLAPEGALRLGTDLGDLRPRLFCPGVAFPGAVITCWRLRAKSRRLMSFRAGPRRCCRPRRWRRSAGSARAGPIPPELRCPRACRPPAAPPADVAHRWCDARTDHDYRVPKRAIKIRNQASYTQAQAKARRGWANESIAIASELSAGFCHRT